MDLYMSSTQCGVEVFNPHLLQSEEGHTEFGQSVLSFLKGSLRELSSYTCGGVLGELRS